jgi:thioesterase domain-containing protein
MPGEEPRTSIEEIAAHCRQQLIHEGEYREWSLLGWSFGGVLAYEMARQMLAEGLPVRRVVLVDSFLAAASTGSDVGAAREQSERTEFDDLFATHDMGAHGADMEAAFAMYRANLTALRRYEPQPCRLPVIDIRAERVLGGPGSSARAGPPVSSLSDQRSVVRVPGDHYSVFSPEYLGALARAVSTAVGSDDTRAKPRLL